MRIFKAWQGIAHAASAQGTRMLEVSRRRFKNAVRGLQSGLGNEAGYTLIEIAFTCEVLMLLTLVGFNESKRIQEHAKVAACLSYHVAIQRTLWADYALTGDFPDDLAPILAEIPHGRLDAAFDYKGGTAKGMFGDYYIRCKHNHSYVGVLFVDSGSFLPPKAIYNLATARGTVP